jgi:hypothetical protein
LQQRQQQRQQLEQQQQQQQQQKLFRLVNPRIQANGTLK